MERWALVWDLRTDVVVETEERSAEFWEEVSWQWRVSEPVVQLTLISLHDDPYLRADTLVDEL